MNKVLVNCSSQPCTGKGMVRLIDCLVMTVAVHWDVNPQTKQTHKTKYCTNCIFTVKPVLVATCPSKQPALSKQLLKWKLCSNSPVLSKHLL